MLLAALPAGLQWAIHQCTTATGRLPVAEAIQTGGSVAEANALLEVGKRKSKQTSFVVMAEFRGQMLSQVPSKVETHADASQHGWSEPR